MWNSPISFINRDKNAITYSIEVHPNESLLKFYKYIKIKNKKKTTIINELNWQALLVIYSYFLRIISTKITASCYTSHLTTSKHLFPIYSFCKYICNLIKRETTKFFSIINITSFSTLHQNLLVWDKHS